MTRYFFVILLMGLIGVAIVVKAGITMFAERQYWQDVADRFVKENVTVKPNRGNIISSDGKLMASSLPEYRIYMDFKAGGVKKDTMLMNHLDEICEGLHKIFPDKSASEFKTHLKKGRKQGSRNYLIYPKRISYIQYKEAKRLPVFNLNKYKGGFHELAYNQRKLLVHLLPVRWGTYMPIRPRELKMVSSWLLILSSKDMTELLTGKR